MQFLEEILFSDCIYIFLFYKTEKNIRNYLNIAFIAEVFELSIFCIN